jgi:hypothetical protein
LSLGNNALDAHASKADEFLLSDVCFLNLAEYASLEQTEPIHLEPPKLPEVFLEKLIHFLLCSKELDAPPSNTNDFISSNT